MYVTHTHQVNGVRAWLVEEGAAAVALATLERLVVDDDIDHTDNTD